MGKTKIQNDQSGLEKRQKESKNMIAEYPDRVPVIVERFSKTTDLPEIEKKKFLVPRDMSVGQFVLQLRGRLRLPKEKAMFIFVDNTMPITSSLIQTVYDSYKDDDGFLYMCYSSENTFGGGCAPV